MSLVFRSDVEFVPFTLPFDWHSDPLRDKNWMFQLHAWRMLDACFNAMYQREEPEHALDQVISVIHDWHRGNVAEGPGAWSWYDMSTGIRASKLAFLSRVMQDLGRDINELDFIPELVSLHLENLMDPKQLSKGNHGLFQLWGLKSLAAAFPDHPLSPPATEYAIAQMVDLTGRQMGEYGVHTEDSPAYHFFAIARIRAILNTPDWQIPEMAFIRQKLDDGERAKPWLFDVQGRKVPVGDSENSKSKEADPKSLGKWPHEANGNLMGAVLDGYAVIRTGPDINLPESSFLFQTASFHNQAHKHADCLSFIWQEKGEEILIDSGKYGYSKDPFRGYFLSTHAHNTVEVNSRSFSRKAKDAYGSGVRQLKPLADGWLIDTEAPHLSDGYTHRRSVIFRPGAEVIVFDHVQLHDRLTKAKNDFTVWWHFPQNVIVSQDDNVVRLNGFKNIDGASVNFICNADRYDIEQFSGVKGDRYQGWVSTGYLQAEPAPVVGFSSCLTGDFLAVTKFQIDGRSAPGRSISEENVLATIDRLTWSADVIEQLKRMVRP